MSKFYEKFTAKPLNSEKNEKLSDKKIEKKSEKKVERKIEKSSAKKPYNEKKPNKVSIRREMFSQAAIPEESREVIANFNDIVESVRNLSGKQKVSLYGIVKKLSHQLTDDRSSRRIGYMNEASHISAYISYFMWWNLVRQTSLFANLPKTAFDSIMQSDSPIAIDIGSGTLTAVISLWLARPELRKRNITWYCMDLSQTALSAGEDLYLAIAAKTLINSENHPWNIIRVKGALGTSIKEKADLITCANVFNEIIQNKEMPTDFLAKKYTEQLLSYAKSGESSILLIEPGDPHSARFISLMRDALIRKDFTPLSPCPHSADCPMAGRTRGKTTNEYGKNAKWCNFAFETDSAPEKLLKFSEKAGLSKERAGLSFILAKKTILTSSADSAHHSQAHSDSPSSQMFIRIASDYIRLPDLHKSGYYACSEKGLLLAIDESHIQPKNGELLQIKKPESLSTRDKKSGALIVSI